MDTSTIAISTMNPRAVQTCRCEFLVLPSRGRYRSTTIDELRAARALSKLDMAAASTPQRSSPLNPLGKAVAIKCGNTLSESTDEISPAILSGREASGN